MRKASSGLSVCMFISLSLYLSVSSSQCLSICLSFNLSVSPSLCLSLHLSVSMSVYLPLCTLSLYLSVPPSLCLSISLHFSVSSLVKMSVCPSNPLITSSVPSISLSVRLFLCIFLSLSHIFFHFRSISTKFW
jgi:hypothetical protein